MSFHEDSFHQIVRGSTHEKMLIEGLSDLSLDLDGILQSDVPQDFTTYKTALESALNRAEAMRDNLEKLVEDMGLTKKVYG